MAKLVDEGENYVANVLFGSTNPSANYYLGLYKNATEPLETANLASLTEVSGAGYARKTLARGSWTIAGSLASFAKQTFGEAEASWGLVTGCFLATTADNSGKLLIAESFPDVDGQSGAVPTGIGSTIGIATNVSVA